MADVFNKTPASFVDQNTQFTMINDKIGLTSSQVKTLIENTNFLYNNLGLANILVSGTDTQFPSPGTFADTVVTRTTVYDQGVPSEALGFLFKIPTPSITASLTTSTGEDVGMTLTTSAITREIDNEIVTTGYNFAFSATLPDLLNADVLSHMDYNSTTGRIDLLNTNGFTSNKASFRVYVSDTDVSASPVLDMDGSGTAITLSGASKDNPSTATYSIRGAIANFDSNNFNGGIYLSVKGKDGSSTIAEKIIAITPNHFQIQSKQAGDSGYTIAEVATQPYVATYVSNNHQDISGKENISNKVTSLSSNSTDTQYPSAKCVYDLIGDIDTLLTALNSGGGV